MAERSGNERGSAPKGRSSGWSPALAGRWARNLTLAALASCWIGACEDRDSQREWPAGTLVAIDEIPITAHEMAQGIAAVLLIEPQWGEAQLARLAFNEIALPRALLRAQASTAAREAARRSLDDQFARITSGSQFGPPTSSGALGDEVSGHWRDIGLLAWATAISLEPGTWSEVIEEPGAFARVRLLSRTDGPVPAAARLHLDRIEASYVANPGRPRDLDKLMKEHRLTIVDPTWETIVPERTKYMMGVHE